MVKILEAVKVSATTGKSNMEDTTHSMLPKIKSQQGKMFNSRILRKRNLSTGGTNLSFYGTYTTDIPVKKTFYPLFVKDIIHRFKIHASLKFG